MHYLFKKHLRKSLFSLFLNYLTYKQFTSGQLKLLFLLIEIVNDDRNEKIEREKRSENNKSNKEEIVFDAVVSDRLIVHLARRINGGVHYRKPAFECCNLNVNKSHKPLVGFYFN